MQDFRGVLLFLHSAEFVICHMLVNKVTRWRFKWKVFAQSGIHNSAYDPAICRGTSCRLFCTVMRHSWWPIVVYLLFSNCGSGHYVCAEGVETGQSSIKVFKEWETISGWTGSICPHLRRIKEMVEQEEIESMWVEFFRNLIHCSNDCLSWTKTSSVHEADYSQSLLQLNTVSCESVIFQLGLYLF